MFPVEATGSGAWNTSMTQPALKQLGNLRSTVAVRLPPRSHGSCSLSGYCASCALVRALFCSACRWILGLDEYRYSDLPAAVSRCASLGMSSLLRLRSSF